MGREEGWKGKAVDLYRAGNSIAFPVRSLDLFTRLILRDLFVQLILKDGGQCPPYSPLS